MAYILNNINHHQKSEKTVIQPPSTTCVSQKKVGWYDHLFVEAAPSIVIPPAAMCSYECIEGQKLGVLTNWLFPWGFEAYNQQKG